MREDNISIVLVCDDYYAILMVAFLKSVELNHVSPEIVDVYIVDDHISAHNKEKVVNSLHSPKLRLHWIDIDKVIPEDVNLPFIHNLYPLNIMARIFIPDFIPADIGKVIYFDVDMIMLSDISELWNIDIGEYVIGAVSDTIGMEERTIGNGIENYKELGLDPDDRYFNSGLLVINTGKWRDEGITQKTLSVVANNKKYAKLSDQYGLNVALVQNWFELDPLWSCFSVSEIPKPHLVHYFHRKPIYKSYANNYRDEFYYYLNQTEWVGFTPITRFSRYRKKVRNIVEKIKFSLR